MKENAAMTTQTERAALQELLSLIREAEAILDCLSGEFFAGEDATAPPTEGLCRTSSGCDKGVKFSHYRRL